MILPQENSTVGTVIILDKGSIKAFEEHLEIDELNAAAKQNDTSVQIHLTLPPYSKLQKASLEYFRIASEITDPSWSKLALFHVNYCNFKNWQDPNLYSLANQVVNLGSVDKTPSYSPQPLPLHSIISSLLANLTQENGKPLKLLRIVYLRLASKEQIDRELKGLEMVEETSSPLFVPDLTVLLNHYLVNQYLAQMKPNTPKLEIQAVCVNCCPYKSDFELPPLKKEFLECGFGVSETIFTSYLDIPSKIQQLAMSHWDLYSIDLIKEPSCPPSDSTEKRLKIDEALQSKDLSVLSRFNYCRALNAPHIDHRIHWSDPGYLASRSIKMYLGTNPNFDTSLPLTQCIHKLCYRDLDESYGHEILKPLVDLSQPYYLLQDEVSHNDEDIYMHQYMIKKDGDYLTIHCLLQVFQDKQQESPQVKPSATEADYIGWDVFKRDFIQASMPNSTNMIDLIESAESINDADKQPFLVTALIPQNQSIEINSQIASKLPLTTTFMNNYIWWETNLICEEEDSSEYIRFIQQNRSLHLLKSNILSPKEFNAFEIDTTLDLFSKCFLSLPKVSSYDPDNLDKTEPPLLLFIRMPYLLQRLYNSFPHCRQLVPHMVSTLVSLLNNLSDLFHQLGILLPYQVDQIKKNYVPNPTRMKKHFTQHLIQNWNPVHTKIPTDAIALYHLHYHQFQKECPSLFFASGPCPLSIKTQHGSFDGLEWLKILMSISPTAD